MYDLSFGRSFSLAALVCFAAAKGLGSAATATTQKGVPDDAGTDPDKGQGDAPLKTATQTPDGAATAAELDKMRRQLDAERRALEEEKRAFSEQREREEEALATRAQSLASAQAAGETTAPKGSGFETVRQVKNATVRVRYRSYINDGLREAGEIVTGYTGGVGPNLEVGDIDGKGNFVPED